MNKRFFLLLFSILILPFAAQAHISGDVNEVNGYRVEFGHLPADPIPLNEDTTFTISFEDLKQNPVVDAQAWIRISLGDTVKFSSTAFQTHDLPFQFDYSFDQPGDYTVDLRLVDVSTKKEATTSFPLTVAADTSASASSSSDANPGQLNLSLFAFFLGLVGGIFLTLFFKSQFVQRSQQVARVVAQKTAEPVHNDQKTPKPINKG